MSEDQIMYKYIGGGDWWKNIPARNLRLSDVLRLEENGITEEKIMETGLYIEYDGSLEITDAAAELAEEHGIDIDEIVGTGAKGKITKTDVENHIKSVDVEDPEGQ